jgi:hypothetical protein
VRFATGEGPTLTRRPGYFIVARVVSDPRAPERGGRRWTRGNPVDASSAAKKLERRETAAGGLCSNPNHTPRAAPPPPPSSLGSSSPPPIRKP